MLDKVKAALRIKSSAFDDELNDAIAAAKLDLGIAGVSNDELEAGTDPSDRLLVTAIETYCMYRHMLMHGEPNQLQAIKTSYDEQKAQLATCTGYTRWSE
jgi:hypothetical protein